MVVRVWEVLVVVVVVAVVLVVVVLVRNHRLLSPFKYSLTHTSCKHTYLIAQYITAHWGFPFYPPYMLVFTAILN